MLFFLQGKLFVSDVLIASDVLRKLFVSVLPGKIFISIVEDQEYQNETDNESLIKHDRYLLRIFTAYIYYIYKGTKGFTIQ